MIGLFCRILSLLQVSFAKETYNLIDPTCISPCVCTCHLSMYGVATVIRIDKMIGLFCRILSLLQVSFAKTTNHCKGPTSRTQPTVHIRPQQPTVHVRPHIRQILSGKDPQDTLSLQIFFFKSLFLYVVFCKRALPHYLLPTHPTGMGWLRLVGSLKLQVSFEKEPYKRDDILQKRPLILRSLLIVATPQCPTGSDRYRVAKTHRMPYLYKSFSAKEPYNQWLFCGKRTAT